MKTLVALLALCADDWTVAPAGTPQGDGSPDRPLDLATALAATARVKPGDTVWIRGGTYRHPRREHLAAFDVRLTGTETRPVHVRAVPGERVTIDGGLAVAGPSAYVWIRDLEITVSEPRREPRSNGPGRPWGGLHVATGKGCKYINLVIHDCLQAISFWIGAVDSEVYGCLLYDNGWQGTSRHHGHCIYTQNRDGVKTISNCILSARREQTAGSYTVHAYGSSKAFVDNYLLEENIAYGEGPFLVGGDRPSRGIRVFRNYLHGVDLRVGYSAPENEDCEIRDNVIVNGRLDVVRYKRAVREGNLVLAKGDPRPDAPKAILLPNKYDPNRAHLAIYAFGRKDGVAVPVAGFLKPGDAYRLQSPRDFYGAPLLEGTCSGETIPVPMTSEFAAFVLLRTTK
jgi:hypothetical protein